MEIIKILDPSKDLYLRDHKLDGKPVLPAAMAMELMAEVAAQAWPEYKLTEVSNFRVLKGIVVQNGAKSIRVIATPKDSSVELKELDVLISSIENPGIVCYSATVKLARTLPEPTTPSDKSQNSGRPFPMTVHEAYRQWLFHGPTLQGIREIQGVNRNGIRAWLNPSFPQHCLSGVSGGSWLIDPVIVDSGFQLVILWARMHWDMTPLPSRCEAYKRLDSISGEQIDCSISILPSSRRNTIHFNMRLFDVGGRLLGFMEDMEFTCNRLLNRLSTQKTDMA
jgi:hypothetical protein